jgi:hypothetical protein
MRGSGAAVRSRADRARSAGSRCRFPRRSRRTRPGAPGDGGASAPLLTTTARLFTACLLPGDRARHRGLPSVIRSENVRLPPSVRPAIRPASSEDMRMQTGGEYHSANAHRSTVTRPRRSARRSIPIIRYAIRAALSASTRFESTAAGRPCAFCHMRWATGPYSRPVTGMDREGCAPPERQRSSRPPARTPMASKSRRRAIALRTPGVVRCRNGDHGSQIHEVDQTVDLRDR